MHVHVVTLWKENDVAVIDNCIMVMQKKKKKNADMQAILPGLVATLRVKDS